MQDHQRTAIVVVAPDGSELVLGHLPAHPPDLGLLDALLRCQLDARRDGRSIRLRDPSAELRALLELTGLGGLLGLDAGREPEGGGLGPDEVVQPGDLAS